MSQIRCIRVLTLSLGLCGFADLTRAAPLLELTVGDETYVGKSLGHDEVICWLAQQDGRLSRVPLQEVTSFRRLEQPFQRLDTVDIRNDLRREFGHDWEIVSTGHYLVCAPKGRARLFADAFEDLYRSFRSYFSRRGFELPQPEFPMIAIVHPTEQAFAKNCAKDGVPFVPGLKGYYHRLTNRTTLFESDDDRLASANDLHFRNSGLTIPTHIPSIAALSRFSESGNDGQLWNANIEADLKNTIVHEATHQVAYNLGIHSRIGENPKWITEGLATMFEAEGTRRNTGGRRPEKRLNPERFARFAHYAQHRREARSLARFIMGDRAFQTGVLDAYAEAWALTFFLAETRSSQHADYLQTIAKRDPLQPYPAEERLDDFQDAFGDDLDRLEVSFLRFLEDLQ